jgi:hypothetical protein
MKQIEIYDFFCCLAHLVKGSHCEKAAQFVENVNARRAAKFSPDASEFIMSPGW